MKLYYAPGACSLAPHIALVELGLRPNLERVNLATRRTATGADFLDINPKGYVPALELDNREILTEVPVILEYLADQAPRGHLMPARGLPRYRVQEWLSYIASEVHKSYTPLFHGDLSEAARKQAWARLGQRYDFIERALDGCSYLMGEDYSVADIYLHVVTRWAAHFGFDLQAWPLLQRFQVRMAAHPAVASALQAEGLQPAA